MTYMYQEILGCFLVVSVVFVLSSDNNTDGLTKIAGFERVGLARANQVLKCTICSWKLLGFSSRQQSLEK